jgi:hypothetical protein
MADQDLTRPGRPPYIPHGVYEGAFGGGVGSGLGGALGFPRPRPNLLPWLVLPFLLQSSYYPYYYSPYYPYDPYDLYPYYQPYYIGPPYYPAQAANNNTGNVTYTTEV